MELRSEQLANCLSFDEVTFNYAPDGNSSHCLKLICPFWLLPYPRGLSVSGYLPLLLLTSLLPPWVSAAPNRSTSRSRVQTVFCLLKSGPLGGKMKGGEPPPSQGKDQAGQFPLTLSPSWSLYSLGPQRPTEPETRSLSSVLLLPSFNSQHNRWQHMPSEHNSSLKT